MLENREVTWFPSYGAEVRGGTANCTIIISDELIGSPIVTCPDILIVMNDASLTKFQPHLKEDGLLIYDASLMKNLLLRNDIEVLEVPATEISAPLGDTKAANMILLGVLVAKTGLTGRASVLEALESSVPERKKKGMEINRRAIIEGIRFVEDKKG